MKTILCILAILTLISCKTSSDNQLPQEPVDLGEIIKTSDYKIAIKSIDSLHYHQTKNTSLNNKLNEITDAKQLMKAVKPHVELFQEEDYDVPFVRAINFEEGGTYTSYYDAPFALRFYPDLSILVCEGGHSSDQIFHLKNGLTEEVIGDPATYVTSTNATYQLAGYYNGQMSENFIQHKTKNGYEKIVPLQDILVEKFKKHLVSYEAKWSNDSTLLLYAKDLFDEKTSKEVQAYFQITILQTNKSKESTNQFKSKSYHTFVPQYVTITDSIIGDIDGDGKMDIVLMTEQNHTHWITKSEYGETINENPRGLIIALKRGDSYFLFFSKHDCFAPFQSKNSSYSNELSLEIKDKLLKIFCSFGRFGGAKYTFTFYKNKMELTTYEHFEFELGMAVKKTTIDFHSKQKTIWECMNVWEVAHNEASVISNETKKKITFDQKLTLNEIGDFTEINIEEHYR